MSVLRYHFHAYWEPNCDDPKDADDYEQQIELMCYATNLEEAEPRVREMFAADFYDPFAILDETKPRTSKSSLTQRKSGHKLTLKNAGTDGDTQD